MREAETMDLTLDVLYFSTYFNEHAWLYNSKNWRNRRTTGKLGFGRKVWLLSGLPGSGRVHALCRPSSVRGRECLRPRGAGGHPGVLACPEQSPCPDYMLWVPRQGHSFSCPNLLCRPLVWGINKAAFTCKQGYPASEQKGPQQMEAFHIASEPPTQFSTSPQLSLVPPVGKCCPSFRETQEGWRDWPVTWPYSCLCLY